MVAGGDGVVDKDVTVLQLRHMLGTPNFPNSVQAIDKPGDEEKSMGPYFPPGRYMTPSAFEIVVPCLIGKH